MAITQAQACWLSELELYQHSPTFSQWHLFIKGATVYLISTLWLSSFRLKVFSALLNNSEITLADCPIDNSAILPLLEGETATGEILSTCTLLPESVYAKLFRHLCGDVNFELKGWVMWGHDLSQRLLIRRFSVFTRVMIEGEVWTYSLTFTENESVSEIVHKLYAIERRLLTKKSIRYWQVRASHSGEEITQLMRSAANIDSYAEEISEEMFTRPILSVLSTLDVVVMVKDTVKNKFTWSLNPKKLFVHEADESAVGMENLGNTCFLNSILQSLAHIPQIAIYYYQTQGDPRKALNYQLGELVKSKYAREGVGCLVPRDLKQTLGTSFAHYTQRQQQDADELLLRMLQSLISEEAQNSSQYAAHPGPSLLPSLSALLSHVTEHYSFLASQFTGLYRESVTCGNCKYVRNRYTPFVTFSLYLTPMRLFSVRYIDYSSTVPQKTFRVDIEAPMEQEITLLNIWTVINEKTGSEHMLLGIWKNNQFSGPLELDYAPSQHPIVVFRLPEYSKDRIAIIFDVFKVGQKSPIGTRVLVCDESEPLARLPSLLVSYLSDMANFYLSHSSIYVQLRANKVHSEQKEHMSDSCLVKIIVKDQETGRDTDVDLETWGCMTDGVGALLQGNENSRREIRVKCIFAKLPKIVIEALRSFKEDKNISVKKYSEKTVAVTLHQLIAYNCREQSIDGAAECDECCIASQRTIQTVVERFPAVTVFPIHRGVVKEGELQKSQMEVCFPAANLDLSNFERSPSPSNPLYDLVAVVKHLGRGYKRGHYVAYAKNPINSGWYFCSDKKCVRVKEEEVLRTREASLLIYTRK